MWCLWSQTLRNCTSQAETVFHMTSYTQLCRVCDGLVRLSCVLGKPHPAGSCAPSGAGEGTWALRCCSGADLLLCWRKPPVTIELGPSVGFFHGELCFVHSCSGAFFACLSLATRHQSLGCLAAEQRAAVPSAFPCGRPHCFQALQSSCAFLWAVRWDLGQAGHCNLRLTA